MASYEKLNYFLRPSKQVERKLFIEALQRLSKAGYYVTDYTYLGLGSVYFADFILVHKYLLIDNMVCAEHTEIPKRMRFNKPYDFIKVEMAPVNKVLNDERLINRTKPHVVWLDYDFSLNDSILDDIRDTVHVLAPGSVFLVTVTADPKALANALDEKVRQNITDIQRRDLLVAFLNNQFGTYLLKPVVRADLSYNRLPLLMIDVLQEHLKQAFNSRPSLKFYQLFNFKYADGVQMLSLGGLIDNDDAGQKLTDAGIYDLDFIETGKKPIEISVPPLTMREKDWLDQHMVRNSEPPVLDFELGNDLLKNYIKYYRHYPVYNESLI